MRTTAIATLTVIGTLIAVAVAIIVVVIAASAVHAVATREPMMHAAAEAAPVASPSVDPGEEPARVARYERMKSASQRRAAGAIETSAEAEQRLIDEIHQAEYDRAHDRISDQELTNVIQRVRSEGFAASTSR